MFMMVVIGKIGLSIQLLLEMGQDRTRWPFAITMFSDTKVKGVILYTLHMF